MKHYVATISRGTQSVLVMSVDGLVGYEFGAVGKESLPLAVDLAVLQTQKGISEIDCIIQEQKVPSRPRVK